MASTKAVYASLKMLSHNFAGTVTDEKVELWEAALESVSDEALLRAVPKAIATHKGDFIPPVAVIREAAGANATPVIDYERIQRQIGALGSYNPNCGWMYPGVENVREALGDAVASAYAACGAKRLFADDEIGRSIAEREFRRELEVQSEQGNLMLSDRSQKQITGATE